MESVTVMCQYCNLKSVVVQSQNHCPKCGKPLGIYHYPVGGELNANFQSGQRSFANIDPKRTVPQY